MSLAVQTRQHPDSYTNVLRWLFGSRCPSASSNSRTKRLSSGLLLVRQKTGDADVGPWSNAGKVTPTTYKMPYIILQATLGNKFYSLILMNINKT